MVCHENRSERCRYNDNLNFDSSGHHFKFCSHQPPEGWITLFTVVLEHHVKLPKLVTISSKLVLLHSLTDTLWISGKLHVIKLWYTYCLFQRVHWRYHGLSKCGSPMVLSQEKQPIRYMISFCLSQYTMLLSDNHNEHVYITRINLLSNNIFMCVKSNGNIRIALFSFFVCGVGKIVKLNS